MIDDRPADNHRDIATHSTGDFSKESVDYLFKVTSDIDSTENHDDQPVDSLGDNATYGTGHIPTR